MKMYKKANEMAIALISHPNNTESQKKWNCETTWNFYWIPLKFRNILNLYFIYFDSHFVIIPNPRGDGTGNELTDIE